MPFFVTDKGISLYYEQSDNDESKPYCVLISGLTRDHCIWRKMVPLLAKTYRVVTFDNRDVGQSSLSPQAYDIVDMADDVAELLQENHMYPAYVVGHSMGGFMALYLAARYPHLVKALALCGTIEKQNDAAKQYLQLRIDAMAAMPKQEINLANPDLIRLVMPHIYAKRYLDDATFVNDILEYETHNPYPQKAEGFMRQARACILHDATDELANIAAPTLVLTGEQDALYTPAVAQALASKIKGAQYTVIPDAAHMLPLENPQFFYHTLKTFFDSQS